MGPYKVVEGSDGQDTATATATVPGCRGLPSDGRTTVVSPWRLRAADRERIAAPDPHYVLFFYSNDGIQA